MHCHATEDEEKVRMAFSFITGVEKPRETRGEGYHGNPIMIYTATLEGSAKIAEFWRRVGESGQLERILENLEERVDDECNLHVRFSKQEAFEGRIVVAAHGDVISLKAKIAAYPAKREKALEISRSYLQEV